MTPLDKELEAAKDRVISDHRAIVKYLEEFIAEYGLEQDVKNLAALDELERRKAGR